MGTLFHPNPLLTYDSNNNLYFVGEHNYGTPKYCEWEFGENGYDKEFNPVDFTINIGNDYEIRVLSETYTYIRKINTGYNRVITIDSVSYGGMIFSVKNGGKIETDPGYSGNITDERSHWFNMNSMGTLYKYPVLERLGEGFYLYGSKWDENLQKYVGFSGEWDSFDIEIAQSLDYLYEYCAHPDNLENTVGYRLYPKSNNYFNSTNGYTMANLNDKRIAMVTELVNIVFDDEYKHLVTPHLIYNINRNIIRILDNKTKTYTNSTWNTSKTWYIKTTFSQGTTSNVVNYDTIYVTKRIYMKILLYTYLCITY